MSKSSNRKVAVLGLSAAITTILSPTANAGVYVWSSGNYGAGSLPEALPGTLGSSDVLTITPTGYLAFSGAGTVLTNNGTVNDTGAEIAFTNGGAVVNTGTWDILGSDAEFYDNGGGGSFTNTGLMENNGSSTFTVTTTGSLTFSDNGGTLDAALNSITINGSGSNSFTGTTFEGSPGVLISANATFGGTLTSSNNALQLVGGTYSTTASGATLSGTAEWSGGTLQGTWTVASGSTLTSTNQGVLNGPTTLTNNGTIDWATSGNLYFENGAVLVNNGTFNVSGYAYMEDGGGGGAFQNKGTFINTYAGAIEVNTSTSLAFIDTGGTINASGGAINFNGGNASFTGTSFTGIAQGDVIAGNAVFNGTINSSSNALELLSGTYTSATGVTLAGTSTAAGGTFAGAFAVASGATLTNTGTVALTGAGNGLTNNGTVDVSSSGYIYLENGAALVNNGLITVSNDAYIQDGGGGGNFNNFGTFNVTSAANGTVEINTSGSLAFVNESGGILETGSGSTLGINGGNVAFNDNTFFNGTGTIDVNSNATFNGLFTVASGESLVLNGGTMTGVATTPTPGGATLSGVLTWNGGTLQGLWVVPTHSSINSTATGVLNGIAGGTQLTNNGTINWNNSGYLFFENGALLVNNGTLDVTGYAYLQDGGGGGTYQNFGTFTNSLSSGQNVLINTSGSFAFINESGGSINTVSGGATGIDGGNVTFDDNTKFTGAGAVTVSNNATFNGKFSVASGAALTLGSGAMTGVATTQTPGGATLTGALTWSGATLQGLWVVNAGSTVTGSGGGGVLNGISGGTQLTNNGTINWVTSDNLYLENGAVLVNNSTFNVSAYAYIQDGGGGGTFQNFGTFTNSFTSGETVQVDTSGSFAFVNESGGIINTVSGATTLFNGGNATFNDATYFTGAGTVDLDDAMTFNGKINVAALTNVVFNGGTYTGAATAGTPTGATLLGAATVASGTFTGLWDVASGSSLTANNGSVVVTGGSTAFNNNGTINWATGSNLYLENGATVTNNGVFTITADMYVEDGGGGGTFVNNGLLQKTDASTSIIGPSGGYALVNNGVIQTLGGGTLALGTFTNGASGTLAGTATFTASTLTNNGTVAPGTFNSALKMTSPGTLSLTGNYIQGSTGILNIGLISAGNAANGLFAVAGTATLAGTIDVNCLGSCAFSKGSLIEVLSTTAGLTGSISSVVAKGFSNDNEFTAESLNGNEYLLVDANVTAAVPEPETYALMIAGGALMFGLSRRRSRQIRTTAPIAG